jgi:MFS family permease
MTPDRRGPAVIPPYIRWLYANQALNMVFGSLTFASSILVMYLADLNLDKARIGFLLSLFPFCGLVSPLISHGVARMGVKRVFIVFFGVRPVFIFLLVAAPWALAHWGVPVMFAGVAVMLLLFGACRAIGETAYYPWNHEIVPESLRGRVSGIAQWAAYLCAVVAMWVAGLVLKSGEGCWRYQWLIGAGCLIGFLGNLAMLPVPGGRPVLSTSQGSHFKNLVAVFRDRQFRRFMLGVSCFIMMFASFPFLALFARERLMIPADRVVLFDAMAMVGVLVSCMYWGWATDRYGGKPVTIVAMSVIGILPCLWWMLKPGGAGAFRIGLLLAFVFGIMNSAQSIGSFRWFFNTIIPAESRTPYLSIWYAWVGLIGGMAPLLAGHILNIAAPARWRLGGHVIDTYPILFAGSMVMMVAGVLVMRGVPERQQCRTRDYLRAILFDDIPYFFGRALGLVFPSDRGDVKKDL